jgi:hypothetical protein
MARNRRAMVAGVGAMLYVIAVWLFAVAGPWPPAPLQPISPTIAAADASQSTERTDDKPKRSPEEIMNQRFPQPVRVGDLIGLPVLDFNDSTIGYIRQVTRTPDGKIQLIVPYWRWFGWSTPGGFLDRYRRLVAVPIETVAILGRQVNALEIRRADFEAAPTWTPEQNTPLKVDERIKIALGRR